MSEATHDTNEKNPAPSEKGTPTPLGAEGSNFSNLDEASFLQIYESIQKEYARRNAKNPSAPERSPFQDEIDSIDQSVIQRGLYGKFSPRATGTTMHGEEIISRHRGDYYAIPESFDYRLSSGGAYLAPVMHLAAALSDADYFSPLSKLQTKHFFSRIPLPNGHHQAIDMFYKHDRDKEASDSRDPGFVHTFFIMPNAQAERLEAMVRENSDTAELFFQTAAAGLERTSQDGPGIGRIISDEIVIVDADKLPRDKTPSYKLKKLIPIVTTTLKYAKPHGIIALA